MSPAELQAQVDALGPWFYEFDFGQGVKTTPAIPAQVVPIHETRRAMVDHAVERHFGPRLRETATLDIGCHEGYYSLHYAPRVQSLLGIDVREESLQKARFGAEVLGIANARFATANLETLQPEDVGTFDLTLFLGVLYHLENPMLCLRNIARLTRELCVIETQVVEEVEGSTEWGAREWTRPYHGILAVIDETGEYDAGNRETGSSPIATCPSPKALFFLLKQAGFRRVEMIPPPVDGYEQHRRFRRVVCAAYK